MPQGDYIELAQKRYGRRLDHDERMRTRAARAAKSRAEFAQKVTGLRAKLYNKKRFAEKVELKKTLRLHEEKTKKLDEPARTAGARVSVVSVRAATIRAKNLSSRQRYRRRP